MLAGRRAFEGQSNVDTMAAVEHEEPRPLQEFVKDVPDDLERIIRRCLRKHPEERYASMSEIERELEDCALSSGVTSGINLRVLFLRGQRPKVAIPALLVLLLSFSLIAWFIHRSYKIRWARDQAVPQIAKLIEQEKFGEAYELAVQAERYIPKDPVFAKFWPDISWTESINTSPSGVSIYRKNYTAPDIQYEFVGRSPVKDLRLPLVDSMWKFELNGFVTVQRATFPAFPNPMTVTLDQQPDSSDGTVRVDFPISDSGQNLGSATREQLTNLDTTQESS